MAIDWASDHFVRLYTRDTEDDLLLSWEARAIWHELLRKFDKQGFIKAKQGARGIAALIRLPYEVVERALPDLLEDGRLQAVDGGFFAPNYQDANYTPRSTGARRAYTRIRTQLGMPVQDEASQVPPDPDVTRSHAESREVTRSHKVASGSDQGRSEHAQSRRARARSGAGVSVISPDWTPRPSERDLAAKLGLDVDAEAREFVAYWLGEGKAKQDWNQTFVARLEKRGAFEKLRRSRNGGTHTEPREINEL